MARILYNPDVLGKDKIVDEEKIREIAVRIAQSIEYLHQNGIILRDFSLQSIVIEKTHDNSPTPKLSKFDRSIILGPGE